MGASSWIAFAKAYHKKHGGSYSAALKAAGPLWRKQKAGKGSVDDEGKKKVKRRRRKK
jgi:hypothetical protein